jgi:hypothetical protein
MKYSDWLKTVPREIRDDTLWNLGVYWLALFSAEESTLPDDLGRALRPDLAELLELVPTPDL